MAKETKPELVEIPKEEYEELKRSNRENGELIEDMIGKLDQLQTAQLAGAGIDPKIAARLLLPRRTVQFLQHYNRCAVPSDIQKGAIIIESYAVSCMDIVRIRDDEFKRIKAEFPEMFEADESKFVDKINHRAIQELDEQGRMRWKKIEKPIKVKELLKLAYEVG